jgi:outer membrane protein
MPSRQTFMALLATVSFVVPSLAHAAEQKIAYVDYNRAFLEVDEGKAAKAKLEGMRDAKQKEIDKEQEALKKERDTFEKQMSTMTEATRIQQGTELQRKVADLQQRFEKGRAELAQIERETASGIFEKMQPILNAIATRDGFSLVLEKSTVMYGPASLDVTNELIRMYNEKNKVSATAATSKTPASTTPKKSDTPKK